MLLTQTSIWLGYEFGRGRMDKCNNTLLRKCSANCHHADASGSVYQEHHSFECRFQERKEGERKVRDADQQHAELHNGADVNMTWVEPAIDST